VHRLGVSGAAEISWRKIVNTGHFSYTKYARINMYVLVTNVGQEILHVCSLALIGDRKN
jgi:hypothetical protein